MPLDYIGYRLTLDDYICLCKSTYTLERDLSKHVKICKVIHDLQQQDIQALEPIQ